MTKDVDTFNTNNIPNTDNIQINKMRLQIFIFKY